MSASVWLLGSQPSRFGVGSDFGTPRVRDLRVLSLLVDAGSMAERDLVYVCAPRVPA
jgi:hypothetical protein